MVFRENLNSNVKNVLISTNVPLAIIKAFDVYLPSGDTLRIVCIGQLVSRLYRLLGWRWLSMSSERLFVRCRLVLSSVYCIVFTAVCVIQLCV